MINVVIGQLDVLERHNPTAPNLFRFVVTERASRAVVAYCDTREEGLRVVEAIRDLTHTLCTEAEWRVLNGGHR